MKHIKTVAMSLFLVNSFSSNEVTWKEIEAEVTPHIKEVESDFSELTKSISEIYKKYREATSTATEFDDFGDYLKESEKTKTRDANMLEQRRQENKNKQFAEKKKQEMEKKKQERKELQKERIKEIKKNITDILTNTEIKIDQNKITSNKDILKGIDNILNIIKKTHSTITNFNNLKTFSEIDEFTKNYKRIRNFLEKNNDLETFFYTLIFNAIKEKKYEILEFFNFPKSIIAEMKERKKTQKIELEDTALTKIAHTVYNYIENLETILNTDRTKFDNFIAKNKITSEYLAKEKKEEKEEEKEEKKYSKKVFKNKSLNDMTIFEALSSEKNQEIVRTESPTILAILEKFKGTEEENKKMTVRRAINIIIDFTELSFFGKKETDKNKIPEEKNKKASNDFNEKKKARIEKLSEQMEKLEKQKKENTSDKDKKILDKEINAIQKTIEKINLADKKIETQVEVEKTTKPQIIPKNKKGITKQLIEKDKKKNTAKKDLEFEMVTKKKQNYKSYDNKEKSKINTEKELGISKEELALAKKNKYKEV